MAHSSRTLMGTTTRIAGAIVALVTAFAAVIGPAANASESAVVTVSNAQLQKTDANGNSLSGQIHEGDVVALTFDWAGQQPTAGDRISVKLPSFLSTLESSHSERFSFTRNGVNTRVGDCRFAERAFNCTFDRGIDDVRAQGFTNPTGTIKVLLRATQTTRSATGHFVVNGQKVAAPIPSGNIQSKPRASHEPLGFSMASGSLTSTSQVVPWTINFGSDYVSQSLAASGGSLPLDGKTRSTLAITGQLGAGQSFSTSDGAWVLTKTTSEQDPDNDERILLTDSSGRDHTKEHGDFDLAVAYEGGKAKLTVTGPWSAGTNYSLNYAATLDDSGVTPDFKYTSSASIDGTSVAASASRTYTRPFASTVSLQSGFGGFEIGGLVSQQAQSLPSGTVVPVTVEYALPGGATVDSYPGWQAPGSIARSGTGGVATIDVVAGQKVRFPSQFPAGTQVRLAVDASRASGQVSLQHLTFGVAQRATSKLTIASETTASVTFSVRQSGSSQAAPGRAAMDGVEPQQESGPSAPAVQSPAAEVSPTSDAGQERAADAGQGVISQDPTGPATSDTAVEGVPAPEVVPSGDETPNEGEAPDGNSPTVAPPPSSDDDGAPSPPSDDEDPTATPSDNDPSDEDDDRIPLSPGEAPSPDPVAPDDQESPDVSADEPGADDASDASDGDTGTQPADVNDSAADSPSSEPSASADAADSSEPEEAADQTQATELSPLEELGVESEEDFLLRTEDFPFSDDGGRRGSVGAGSDVELDLKPLSTVRPKANDGRILSTGMGMSAGVICAIILGLLGSALVLRRYFE